MSASAKTESQTVKISEDLKNELENLDNVSGFIRSSVKAKLTENKIQDFNAEQIDLDSKKESFQLMKNKFNAKDEDQAPLAENPRGNSQLKIEEQFPSPEHYDKKIDKFQDELKELKLEREKVESEKDKAVLQQAIDGKGGSKTQFEKLKNKLEKLDEKIKHKRELINRLKEFKAEIKEKHQQRQKLQNYLAAEKIKENYLNPIAEKLQQDFNEFVSTYERFKQINSDYDKRVKRAGGNIATGNYGFQQKLGKSFDLDIPSAVTRTNYSDKEFKDILPISKLPENPIQEDDSNG